MDFSSLDLLASTALRDNSPPHAHTAAPPHPHPQQNHHDSADNEEDDDEADDSTDSVKESVGEGDSLPSDLVQGEMGSVKCGKHKKNSAKPMSIIVRDGRCVGKHLSTDVAPPKEAGGEVTGGMTGPQKNSPAEHNGTSCPQNTHCSVASKCSPHTVDRDLTPPAPAQPSCNGIGGSHHQNLVTAPQEDNTAQSAERDSVTALTQSSVSAEEACCDSESASSDQASQQELGVKGEECGSEVRERDCTDRNRSVAELSSDCSPTADPDGAVCGEEQTSCSEQKDEGREDSTCSHKAAGSGADNCQSSVVHSDSSTQPVDGATSCVQVEKGGDSDPSDTLLNSVPDGVQSSGVVSGSAETEADKRFSNICDEDLAAVSSHCPHEVAAVEGSSPCEISLDQDTTGSYGSHEPPPSTSSTQNSDVKSTLSPPLPPPPPPVNVSVMLLDHTYCSRSRGRALDNPEDSGDAFESADENVSADEIERRPRSLSVDSVYLQYNLAGLPTQQEGLSQNDKLALLSPTLSVDSVSNDSSMSEHSTTAGGQCYSILVGSPTPKGTNAPPTLAMMDSQGVGGDKGVLSVEGGCGTAGSGVEAGGSSLLDASSFMAVGPKCGKFRIGTFGSFSNSHLELDKDGKKNKVKNGLSADPVMKTSLSSPAVASPGSPFPLLQSPGIEWDRSDAGSEAPDDLDSSTTDDKCLSSSHDSEAFGVTVGQVWRHPVFHDHDYCSKEVSEEYLGKPVAPTPPLKTGKRKYVKKKDRLESEEEKLRKGKYLKRELLKQDNRFNLGAGRGVENRAVTARSSLLAESLTTRPNPVGRPRKRTEKQLEEYDAETGTKMKITGKYQDQYVYYLNKSSRTRRRKVDEKLPPGDKIILPAPKPGDIVVPHLSDADCEAIRRGGRMALLNTGPHPASCVQLPHSDSGDMDSSIVNTILSMETEHGNLHSPLNAYDGVGTGEDFADIEGNLTSEQVKMLFDCLDDYQMEETTTSQELDLFTSAEAVSAPPPTIDSLAATSVAEDLMAAGVVQPAIATGVTGPATPVSLLGKVEPSSPAHVKLEQETLVSHIKAEVDHTETKPLVRGIPVPPTSQPSVEKNLEFLKTPFFPETSVPSSGSDGLFTPAPHTPLLSPVPDSKSDDVNETPWIVTVTLYFNDIPAIVINNVPHVRLVDIHRQILPAKDTGILKKRCQLMSIQVSNCTEMQRYFLVQYGRAHNSKSTLVISKDEAQRLITYYAHPPPRNLRGEEGTGLRRSASYAELRSIMERPGNPGRHSALPFNQPRKRGGFRRRPLPTRSHNPSPEPLVPSMTPIMEPLVAPPQPPTPPSPAKGLRHKKINFREMLKGEDSSSQLSPLTDSVMEEDTAFVEETSTPKGRGGKGQAAGGKKRRGSKEAGGGSPAKRGRKGWRKKAEGNRPQEDLKKPMELELLDNKDSTSPVTSTKNKKRSAGTPASGTLNASGRSPKAKYGPIKVNVKSLVSSGGSLSSDGSQPRKKNLFGRKSSSSEVVVEGSEDGMLRSNPLRVLRISHQDMEATSPPASQVLSPTAEVHLDLYKRASSPCVKCRTCHKFLSVGDFLKHQHMSLGEVSDSTPHTQLAHSHQRRILVPMNKENISLEEQRLWNEFVALQESLDHSVSVVSMGAFPLTPLSPTSPVSSLHMFENVHSPAVAEPLPVTMTPESPHPTCLQKEAEDAGLDVENGPHPDTVMDNKHGLPHDREPCADSRKMGVLPFLIGPETCCWDSQLPPSSSPSSPLPATHTQNEEKYLENNVDSRDREIRPSPKTVAPSNKKPWSFQRPRRVSPTTSVRTSSRKRETKRLYSFEKYEFGAGGKRGGRGEVDTQDLDDHLADTLLDDVNSVSMGDSVLHLASANMLHEPQNA